MVIAAMNVHETKGVVPLTLEPHFSRGCRKIKVAQVNIALPFAFRRDRRVSNLLACFLLFLRSQRFEPNHVGKV